jgi:competence protein ComEC
LFGHPSGEVIDRLLKHGSKIFRTDKDGCVTVFSDGNNIEIKTMNGKQEKL